MDVLQARRGARRGQRAHGISPARDRTPKAVRRRVDATAKRTLGRRRVPSGRIRRRMRTASSVTAFEETDAASRFAIVVWARPWPSLGTAGAVTPIPANRGVHRRFARADRRRLCAAGGRQCRGDRRRARFVSRRIHLRRVAAPRRNRPFTVLRLTCVRSAISSSEYPSAWRRSSVVRCS